MNKTALVTGCNGYLGTHLCKALNNSGWKIIGLDITNEPVSKISALNLKKYLHTFIRGDICDKDSLIKAFSLSKIDCVFHLAGLIDVADSFNIPEIYFNTNVGGTTNLLNVMAMYDVKNIVFSSSASVYEAQDIRIAENSKIGSNSPYGKSKHLVEEIIKNCNVNHIIFRYFNLAGADLDGEFGENHIPETHLIPLLIRSALNDESFVINGNNYITCDGTCIRDYVHVTDVCEAHVRAGKLLLDSSINNKIINLGIGEGKSILQIIDALSNLMQKEIKYQFGPRRKGDPSSLVADVCYSDIFLDFKTKYDINDILSSAYKWELIKREK